MILSVLWQNRRILLARCRVRQSRLTQQYKIIIISKIHIVGKFKRKQKNIERMSRHSIRFNKRSKGSFTLGCFKTKKHNSQLLVSWLFNKPVFLLSMPILLATVILLRYPYSCVFSSNLQLKETVWIRKSFQLVKCISN